MIKFGIRHNYCPCFHPLAASLDDLPMPPEKEVVGSKKKKSSRRKSFSKLLRTVIFETSMRKSKKIQQDPYQALRNLTSESEKSSLASSNSSLMSSVTSSSRSSSGSSSSRSFGSKSFGSNSSVSSQILLMDEPKQSNCKEIVEPARGWSYSTRELWWVVLSLMVLVFYGRICAIICTATWCYFVLLGRGRRDEVEKPKPRREQLVQEEEIESREYKKRVVMGGFLERRHSRF